MSIKEIAALAGVSAATVSRVLNDPEHRTSDADVRERIWKAARDTNYIPNEAARNLKMGVNTGAVSPSFVNVLVCGCERAPGDPFYTELLHITQSELHGSQCVLSHVWHNDVFSKNDVRSDDLRQETAKMISETDGSGDGLIVIGDCTKPAQELLERSFKNVVLLRRFALESCEDEVSCDGYLAGAAAAEYLFSLGHKAVGYAGSSDSTVYAGFSETLSRRGIDIAQDCLYDIDQTEAEGFWLMERLAAAKGSPTAFFCANDITAVGMLRCLDAKKIKYYTPSIIACNDIEEAQYTRPMLSTVRLPKHEMGKFAVYLLLDRIRGGHKSPASVRCACSLAIRESTLPAGDVRWTDYYI